MGPAVELIRSLLSDGPVEADKLQDEVMEKLDVSAATFKAARKAAGVQSTRKGFGRAGVLEVVDDDDGNTYRAVYTVKFTGVVYVLHAFQKKSRKGSKTPPEEIEKVKARLKEAAKHYAEWSKTEDAEEQGRH